MNSKLTVWALLSSVLLFFCLLFWMRSIVSDTQVTAEQAFGAPFPAQFKVFSTYKTDLGSIGELSVAEPPTLVRLLRVSSSPNSDRVQLRDLLSPDRSNALPKLFYNYFGAHVNRKRIDQVSESALSINGSETLVINFTEKGKDHYQMFIIDNRHADSSLCLVLLMRRDTPVSSTAILGALQALPCSAPLAATP